MKEKIINLLIIILAIIIIINVMIIGRYTYYTQKSSNEFKKLRQVSEINLEDKVVEEYKLCDDEKKTTENNNLSELFKKNKDMVGWINILDTNINYPVMYGKKYLYKDFYKDYSINGTPFTDDKIISNEYTNVLMIQAHNMKDGSMFGGIKKYLDKNYLLNSKNIDFYTEEDIISYQIYGIMILDISQFENAKFYDNMEIENEEQFEDYVNSIDKNIVNKKDVKLKFKDDLIFLSTCLNGDKSKRIVLVGYDSHNN